MAIETDWIVTPRRRFSELPKVITVDDKIDIFCERVIGWQLDIANQLINDIKNEKDEIISRGNPHAGYAVLDIILSYFEMIAKYHDGFLDRNSSRYYFKKGVCMVLEPNVGDPDLMGKLSDILFYEARCGMYHVGVTSKRIFLAGGDIPTIVLQSGMVTINPHRLVLDMKKHFNHYINQLKDKKNSELRHNFEKRFDRDTSSRVF